MCCGVARTVKPAEELTQIPVEVTVVHEQPLSKPIENVPAKSLPEQAAPVEASVVVKTEAVPVVSPSENSVAVSTDKGNIDIFLFISFLFHK